MNIADSIIKNKLKNVYFIWGKGKTTIANELHKKYGFYVYSTDDSREPHANLANPKDQPYMCRDFEREYGVRDFWELPAEVIWECEKHFVEEMTPMIIADLIALSTQYDTIICEGDIDYRAVVPFASHVVYLCNCGTPYDWFDRPDHETLDGIRRRTDLSEAEKQAIIDNAYRAVSGGESVQPDWVSELNIKNINWDDSTSVSKTASDVEAYFGFFKIEV